MKKRLKKWWRGFINLIADAATDDPADWFND